MLNVNTDVFRDAGFWPKIITDTFRTELVIRGTEALQNKVGPIAKVKRDLSEGNHENKSLSRNCFFKKTRKWRKYFAIMDAIFPFKANPLLLLLSAF